MSLDEVEVTTLLGVALRHAGQDPDRFDDLAGFQLTVLHPARTLIEKLCLVHGIAVRILAGNSNVRFRVVRHYYDIYHLLDADRSPALAWLERHDTRAVVACWVRITRAHFAATLEVAPIGSPTALRSPTRRSSTPWARSIRG